MSGFHDHLNIATLLEQTFIETFNQYCKSYRIIKYGIETTRLSEAHEFIRRCKDGTSHFVRYIPDSVLVNIENPEACDTTLIEFKASITGVQKESFVKILSKKCPDMQPPFGNKDDIFNIENDALELYLKLQSIGVRVIIVAYAGYRPGGDRIRAQFAEKIARCNVYNPNLRGQNIGSGTYIANVNFASFVPLPEFFVSEFGINYSCMKQVAENIEIAFNSI